MERTGKLTRKMTRSPAESIHEHKHTETSYISEITDAFIDQKRVNVCENAVKCLWKVPPGGCETGSGEECKVEGKIKLEIIWGKCQGCV